MVCLVQREWNSFIIFRNDAGCATFYSTWQSTPCTHDWGLEIQLLVSILSLLFINLEFSLQKYPYMSLNLGILSFQKTGASNPFINSNTEVAQSPGHCSLWHVNSACLEGNYSEILPLVKPVPLVFVHLCDVENVISWMGKRVFKASISITKSWTLDSCVCVGFFHAPPQTLW